MPKRRAASPPTRKEVNVKRKLKIASWNVCGLRALLKKGNLQELVNSENPDVICLGETMLQNKIIKEVIPQLPEGYASYFHCSTARKGYSGVSILTKEPIIKVHTGMGIRKHDIEGRTLVAEFPHFYLVNTYVPNAGAGLRRLDYRTLEWDVDIRAFLKELNKTKEVIWCGDLNVVNEDIDIYDITGKETSGCCTPQERSGFAKTLRENKLVDSFRKLNPGVREWSYFSRRNRNARQKGQGWRLDYILVSDNLSSSIQSAYIRNDIEGSDHHPCVMSIEVPN